MTATRKKGTGSYEERRDWQVFVVIVALFCWPLVAIRLLWEGLRISGKVLWLLFLLVFGFLLVFLFVPLFQWAGLWRTPRGINLKYLDPLGTETD